MTASTWSGNPQPEHRSRIGADRPTARGTWPNVANADQHAGPIERPWSIWRYHRQAEPQRDAGAGRGVVARERRGAAAPGSMTPLQNLTTSGGPGSAQVVISNILAGGTSSSSGTFGSSSTNSLVPGTLVFGQLTGGAMSGGGARPAAALRRWAAARLAVVAPPAAWRAAAPVPERPPARPQAAR